MTCSQFRLVFQGVTLLDFDEEIEGPVSLPATGAAQVAAFAGAAHGVVFGRGNQRNTVRWTRVKQWSSHEEAAGMSIAGPRRVSRGEVGPLSIEVRNGAKFELRHFVLTEAEGSLIEHHGFPVREVYGGEGAEMVVVDRDDLTDVGVMIDET